MHTAAIITLRRFILFRYPPGRERRAWLKWLKHASIECAGRGLPDEELRN